MTSAELPPTTPLLTLERLAIWTQERPISDTEFATEIIDAVSQLLRDYGDPYWDVDTLPRRARDIGYFVARNYYLNPDLLRAESTGPTSEARAELVLQGIELTQAQKDELSRLADKADDNIFGGLGTIGFTRGPLETGRRSGPRGDTYVYDERGAWPIPYLTNEENFVFEPDGVSLLPEQVEGA